jgi:hypothetical protein
VTTSERYELGYSHAVCNHAASDALHACEALTGARVSQEEWLDIFAGWEDGRADRLSYEADMREGADEVGAAGEVELATTGEK